MKMTLTHKDRINPSPEVQAKLWDVSRINVEIWNYCLDQKNNNPELTVYDQKRELPRLKKEHPELKKAPSQVTQNVVFSLHRSIKMAETKNRQGDSKAKPPRLKNPARFFTQEYSQKHHSFKFEKDVNGKTFLKLAYGARPADWLSIEVEPYNYDAVKTVTVCYKDKKWYACLTFLGRVTSCEGP